MSIYTLYILLAVVTFTLIIADAFSRDRDGKRYQEEKRAVHDYYATVFRGMYRNFEDERNTWRKERTELIDRIQYPNVEYQTFKALNKEKTPSPTEEKKPKPELV